MAREKHIEVGGNKKNVQNLEDAWSKLDSELFWDSEK